MNNQTIIELHEKVAQEVAYKLIEPIAHKVENEYICLSTKDVRRLTGFSASMWSEICKLPEIKAIQHRRPALNGNSGRTIFYLPDEIYPTLRKIVESWPVD